MFSSIVEDPLRELLEIVQDHFDKHTELFSALDAYTHTAGDHEDFVQLLIHHLYANRDAFLLLLTKSQGTTFENFVDDVVEMMEQGYRAMAEHMAEKTPGTKVNSYMLHWMTHMNIGAFVHLLTHEPEEQMALQHMQKIMEYLISGWIDLILTSETEHN